jgi:hypothetical protein
MGLFLAGIVPLGLAPKAVAQAPSTVAPSIRWICSTPAEPWQERSATILASVPDAESNVVKLDPATTYQVIAGWAWGPMILRVNGIHSMKRRGIMR